MINTLRRTRKYWLAVLIIAAVILVFTVWIDPAEIVAVIRQADWRYLAAAGLFLLAGLLMLSLRWRFLLHNQAAYRDVLKSDGMSFFTTSLAPIPAPPLRVITISQISPVTLTAATSGMVVDRLLEQLMRLSCLLLALFLYAQLLISPVALAGNLVGLLLGFLLLFWLMRYPDQAVAVLSGWLGRIPRLGSARAHSLVSNLVQGFVLAGTPARFLLALLLSVVMWLCFFVFQALVLTALGQGLDVRQTAALALATLAIAPPSAPAMPGVYHSVVVASLSLLGVLDATVLTAYAILAHLLQFGYWMTVGIWGLSTSNLRLGELLRFGRVNAASNDSSDASRAPGGDAPDN